MTVYYKEKFQWEKLQAMLECNSISTVLKDLILYPEYVTNISHFNQKVPILASHVFAFVNSYCNKTVPH